MAFSQATGKRAALSLAAVSFVTNCALEGFSRVAAAFSSATPFPALEMPFPVGTLWLALVTVSPSEIVFPLVLAIVVSPLVSPAIVVSLLVPAATSSPPPPSPVRKQSEDSTNFGVRFSFNRCASPNAAHNAPPAPGTALTPKYETSIGLLSNDSGSSYRTVSIVTAGSNAFGENASSPSSKNTALRVSSKSFLFSEKAATGLPVSSLGKRAMRTFSGPRVMTRGTNRCVTYAHAALTVSPFSVLLTLTSQLVTSAFGPSETAGGFGDGFSTVAPSTTLGVLRRPLHVVTVSTTGADCLATATACLPPPGGNSTAVSEEVDAPVRFLVVVVSRPPPTAQ
mmetsp:Transcript_11451/g.42420  ORF Transcript_11451/g.42420 Transcript_11451/m.42420 type:complete len:339 (-) Transcript_11451:3672-4688(-)